MTAWIFTARLRLVPENIRGSKKIIFLSLDVMENKKEIFLKENAFLLFSLKNNEESPRKKG